MSVCMFYERTKSFFVVFPRKIQKNFTAHRNSEKKCTLSEIIFRKRARHIIMSQQPFYYKTVAAAATAISLFTL